MDPMDYLDSLGQFRMRAGLERIVGVLRAFGDPHLSIPAVHIGGTNGKGTTVAMVEAILSTFPLRTGSYTSPHLIDVTERLRIQGENVPKDKLSEGIRRIRDLIEGSPDTEGLTYFEVLTAASYLIMADEGVDINISEVGMGGRWDATNILGPQAVAITSISMDHMEHLGEDPVSITREKCGIIKPSTPVVVGNICSRLEEGNRCLRYVLDVCTRNGCPVVVVSEIDRMGETISLLSSYNVPDWRVIEAHARTGNGSTLIDLKMHCPVDQASLEPRFELLDRIMEGSYLVPLAGKHQACNLAIAVALSLMVLPFALSHNRLRSGDRTALKDLIEGSVDEVNDRYGSSELKEMVRKGISRVSIRGRGEIFNIDGKEIIIDGCHNLEAARALRETIRDIFPGRCVHLLIAMMRDKHPGDMIEPFGGLISTLTITSLPTERSMGTGDLLRGVLMGGKDIPEIHIREEPTRAIEEWLERLDGDSIGVAAGSFYLYRHIREFLGRQKV